MPVGAVVGEVFSVYHGLERKRLGEEFWMVGGLKGLRRGRYHDTFFEAICKGEARKAFSLGVRRWVSRGLICLTDCMETLIGLVKKFCPEENELRLLDNKVWPGGDCKRFVEGLTRSGASYLVQIRNGK